jgi:hypothetical protein
VRHILRGKQLFPKSYGSGDNYTKTALYILLTCIFRNEQCLPNYIRSLHKTNNNGLQNIVDYGKQQWCSEHAKMTEHSTMVFRTHAKMAEHSTMVFRTHTKIRKTINNGRQNTREDYRTINNGLHITREDYRTTDNGLSKAHEHCRITDSQSIRLDWTRSGLPRQQTLSITWNTIPYMQSSGLYQLHCRFVFGKSSVRIPCRTPATPGVFVVSLRPFRQMSGHYFD